MIKIALLKHWQIFIFLFVLPMLIKYFVLDNYLLSKDLEERIFFFPIRVFLFNFPFFVWLYALGTIFYTKLPSTKGVKINGFKRCIYFALTTMAFNAIAIYILFEYNFFSETLSYLILVCIYLLQLINIVCLFYSIYFVARAIVTVEYERIVLFNDYKGTLLALLFFPIGVWMVQPRVNQLLSD